MNYTFGEPGKTQKTGLLLIDSANPTPPRFLMAQDTAVPGAEDGVKYGRITRPQFGFVSPNTVFFFNHLSNKSQGLFLSRDGGDAKPLILKGTEVEIRPGDKRTVAKVQQVGWGSGAAMNGYIPLVMRFKDRKSALVVAELSRQ